MDRWLYGMRIIESIHMPLTVQAPHRKHDKRKSMSDFYHRRIQKKWNKRFGYTDEINYLMANNNIYCHPEAAAKLIDSVDNHNRTREI